MQPEVELAGKIARGQQSAPQITREEVLANRLVHPIDSLHYSMEHWCEHGYRNDCSGKVSEVLEIPLDAPGSWHGLNTATMLTTGPVPGSVWFHEVEHIQPGDVIGILGPGTEGPSGHVRLFLGWVQGAAHGTYRCWEMSGGNGPDERVHADLAAYNAGPYKAYAYVGIVAGSPVVPIPAPTLRHGDEGEEVRLLQQALIHLGYDLGPWGPSGHGDDGQYGDRTKGAVRGFQAAAIEDGYDLGNGGADGIYGPYTATALRAVLDAA